MPNVTIAMDEETLKAGRDYARKHKTSLNALLRKLLRNATVERSSEWIEECFDLMDKAGGRSKGRRWSREELYDE